MLFAGDFSGFSLSGAYKKAGQRVTAMPPSAPEQMAASIGLFYQAAGENSEMTEADNRWRNLHFAYKQNSV